MEEILQTYLVPITMGICYCIGFVVKLWIPDTHHRWIPSICAVCGVIINIWLNNWAVSPEILLGGLASGLAATGLDQLLKTAEKKVLDGPRNS